MPCRLSCLLVGFCVVLPCVLWRWAMCESAMQRAPAPVLMRTQLTDARPMLKHAVPRADIPATQEASQDASGGTAKLPAASQPHLRRAIAKPPAHERESHAARTGISLHDCKAGS